MRAPVSVLLPVQDGAATLRSALGSVLQSRGVDFEVVVVNHGSQDGTAEILADMAARDGRIRVLDVERRVPMGEALERGRQACAAPFVARMDADDLMHPARLRADVALLSAQPEIDAVACRVRLFPRERVGMGMRSYVSWQNTLLDPEAHAREIWIEQPLCHPATTFVNARIDELGGYRHGPFPEDYDLFVRLVVAGGRLCKRPMLHHGWREHGRRSTRVDVRYHRDAFAAVKARGLLARFFLAARPVFIGGTGREGGRIARSLRAAGAAPCLFFDVSERRIGRSRYGVPVLAVERLAAERRAHADAFFIGAVGTSGARGAVRAALCAAGFVEGRDAVLVA